MNYSYLKAKIIENDKTQGDFAADLGITQQELSRKINDKSQFSTAQILKAKEILNLSGEDIVRCFFTE